jgi:hypothetical protein
VAQSNIPRAETVPEFWEGDEKDHRRKMATAVNQLQKGVGNNHFTVSLEVSEFETEVMHPPCRSGAGVQITPASASAATSLAAGGIWVETQNGKAIIHHDSSSASDRTFHLAFNG